MNGEISEFDPGAKIRGKNDHLQSQKMKIPVSKFSGVYHVATQSQEEYIPEYQGYPEDEVDFMDPNLSEFDPGSKLRT